MRDLRLMTTYKDNKRDKFHVIEIIKVATFDTHEEARKEHLRLLDLEREKDAKGSSL